MKKYVIAEISGNHCKSKKILEKTIYGCSKAGADAVKMQFYKAKDLVSPINKIFYKKGIWKNKTANEILRKSETPIELIKYGLLLSKKYKIDFICSVFEPKDISLLKKTGVKNFKIASLEANYIDLIKNVKKLKNKFYISLGAIGVNNLIKYKNFFNFKKNIFFYCRVKYPSRVSDYDLSKIKYLKKIVRNVGISDHTTSLKIGNYAQQFGVQYYEKHVKLNETIKSPDDKFSITVKQLAIYIDNITKQPFKYNPKKITNTKKNKLKTRKIFSSNFLKKNTVLNKNHIKFYRSENGVESLHLKNFLGKKLKNDLKRNDLINYSDISK